LNDRGPIGHRQETQRRVEKGSTLGYLRHYLKGQALDGFWMIQSDIEDVVKWL